MQPTSRYNYPHAAIAIHTSPRKTSAAYFQPVNARESGNATSISECSRFPARKRTGFWNWYIDSWVC